MLAEHNMTLDNMTLKCHVVKWKSREAVYEREQQGRVLLWDRRPGGTWGRHAPYRALLCAARAPARTAWDRAWTTLHPGTPGATHPHSPTPRKWRTAGRDCG